MYIEKFLNYLLYEKRVSAHTHKAYQKDLLQFYAYLGQYDEKANMLEVNYQVIRRWIVELREENISPRSVNRKLSSLRSFYKFLQKEGRVKDNPLDKINYLKLEKKLPSFLKPSEIDNLLDEKWYSDDFEGKRNHLIISLFYFTGMRRSELINLKLQDFDSSRSTVRVLGKRNKERIIPLTLDFFKQIFVYLVERKKLLEELKIQGLQSFFISEKGKQLYDKQVYTIVESHINNISTLDKKSPHIIRHSFATHLLNKGADLNVVKDLLGHANLAATEVYTHTSFEKLKKIYNQTHPRS